MRTEEHVSKNVMGGGTPPAGIGLNVFDFLDMKMRAFKICKALVYSFCFEEVLNKFLVDLSSRACKLQPLDHSEQTLRSSLYL